MILEICMIIIFVFFLALGGFYYTTFLELLFNIPVLYAIYIFSYDDLFHKKYYFEYGTALFSGTIIFAFTFDLYQLLWPLTWWLLLVLVIAKVEIGLNLKEMLIHEEVKQTPQSGLRKVEYEKKRSKKH